MDAPNKNDNSGRSASAGADDPTGAKIYDALPEHLRSQIEEVVVHNGQTGWVVPREAAHGLLAHCRDHYGYEALTDVTAIDYLNKDMRERFQVVYVIQNRDPLHFLRIHAWVPEEDPTIPTVYDLWHSARWGERECHDMFGIEFDGAPDMRRFLMPEDYPGFPLLKDYPLKGHGERVQFPRITPQGDEMKVNDPKPYPTSIGRGMHTPEYLKEIERDSRPGS